MKALLVRTGPAFDVPGRYCILLLFSSSAIVAIGSILKQYDIDVAYWHIPIKLGIPRTQKKYEERLEKFRILIKNSSYDFIGFTCVAGDEYPHILEFAKICNEEKPDTITVLGGYHATALAREIMEESKYIDIIVRGDFEPISNKFVKALKNHKLFKDVPNILFRQNGKIIETPKMLITYDVNSLPFYDFSILEEYMPSLSTLCIEGSRGCMYKCEYCAEANVRGGHFWSVKKPERLVKELKIYSSFMEEHSGYKRFFFADPIFGADRKWLKSFCNKLIKSKLNITWGCETRVERLNGDEISLMRDSGCLYMFHGFESGSPRMLKLMKKTNNPKKYLENTFEVINKGREHGIYILGSYMLGYPGETMDTLQETRNLIEKHISIGGEYFYPTVFLFMPYPNTPAYIKLDEYNKRFGTKVLVDNLWKHSKTPYESITIQPSKELDPDTLLRIYKEIHGWSKGECYSDEFASVFGIPANIDYIDADLIDFKNPCCLPPPDI